MPVEIRLFDLSSASDTELAECHAVATAVMGVDHPEQPQQTLQEHTAMMGRPRTALGPVRRWLAWEDGHVVGQVSVTSPEHENLHLAIVQVQVAPERRRRGIGTALLRSVLPGIGEDGRTVVMGHGIKADASGETWARGLGFVRTHGYVRQVLTLADADPALWQRPVAEGFRLESWTGAAPGTVLAEYARARTAITDAPNGESALAFEDWTPERVRAHEADLNDRGVRNRVTVAVHEDSGRVAALTELSLRPEQPARAFQQDTAVVADFRGRGLGLAVKGAMLRRLEAEQAGIEMIFTQTAYDNAHMIRINHALGFVTAATLSELEIDLAQLAKRWES